MKCLMCNSEQLVSKTENEEISYKGRHLSVPMAFTLCECCGYEFVPAEQIKINDKEVIAAKRLADGLLTPDGVLKIRESLGLTQAQAAEIFGGGRNAFSKYERGEVAQSGAMDKLLRLIYKHPSLCEELMECSENTQSNIVYMEDWKESKPVMLSSSTLSFSHHAVLNIVNIEEGSHYGY